jgi:hypothetical protein
MVEMRRYLMEGRKRSRVGGRKMVLERVCVRGNRANEQKTLVKRVKMERVWLRREGREVVGCRDRSCWKLRKERYWLLSQTNDTIR